ncbi:hydrogenase [Tepiditoga spiralis]|uniref:Hydrogenase n=1 Tax=Tepiditoga spiralis TaxID=2108365 RepID=A0A7G1G4P9_9BACT|nr:hydrogenase [Tepiditoga spiralis]BBE31508.1 hydrogenase [Tepiditoga spiralis]
MNKNFINIENTKKINLSEVPLSTFDDFYNEIEILMAKNAKVIQYFAFEMNNKVMLIIILRTEMLWIGLCEAPNEYESLTKKYEQFNEYEREIAEQFSIKPIGHPWFKSLRYHKNYVGKKDLFNNDYEKVIPGNYPFYKMEGEEVHQVAVGPIHAGVIEPGHFRFNCVGEKVYNLEIQHGYQHRGIEKQLENVKLKKIPTIIESISGDSTIVHSISYSEAIEEMMNIKINENEKLLRLISLELERIANHIGDLGALSGDIAFLTVSSYYGRIRGEFLNILLEISGNRFGRGLIRPGTENMISEQQKNNFIKKIKQLEKEIINVGDMFFSQAGVLSRLEDTGIVEKNIAEKINMVGIVGRASGINYDVRRFFPNESWKKIKLEEIIETSGDAMARAMIRYKETKESLKIVQNLLKKIKSIDSKVVIQNFKLPKETLILTLQEGWRGELSHCIITNKDGKIIRYKIKDPSFNNWKGLEIAVRNEGIYDFPLCNKSFNLSYSGFDL